MRPQANRPSRPLGALLETDVGRMTKPDRKHRALGDREPARQRPTRSSNLLPCAVATLGALGFTVSPERFPRSTRPEQAAGGILRQRRDRRRRPGDRDLLYAGRFHQQLAVNVPNLHITTLDDNRVEACLTVTIPVDPPGSTRIWLASLPGDAQAQPLRESLTWTIAPENVTPFIAVESTAGEGAARVTRRCALKATLSGAVDGRRHDAVFSILRSKERVLRYLVILLGDPSYDALFAHLAGIDGEKDTQIRRPAGHPTSPCSSRWSGQPVATRTRWPGLSV